MSITAKWLLLFQILNFGKMTTIISDFGILVKLSSSAPALNSVREGAVFKADRRQKITLCQLTLIMIMLRSINSDQFRQTHWSHGHHGHQVLRYPISASSGQNELGKKN